MASKIFRAVIMGAPGSGKGTISSRILKRFGFVHLACGDILRNHVQLNTELGKMAKEYLAKGLLVPDDLVTKTILNEINAIGNNKSWLLDGYPRTIQQANSIGAKIQFDAVLNLIVPHSVIIERVQGRWVHMASGRVYNTDFNKPKVPFRDDVTGEALEQRNDDKPETVSKRLEIYENLTKPVTDYYRAKGILHEFTGNTSDVIWPQVEKCLAQFTSDENVKNRI